MDREVKPQVIICDIDGTVALRGDRDPYDMTRVSEDAPDPVVWAVLKAVYLIYGHMVVFTSGRDESAREDTKAWIWKYFGFTDFELLMRAVGDNRQDAVVKQEMLDSIILPQFDVFCAFDDRQQVVDMWRANGIKCFQVAAGGF
jgi:hypothetical protein